MPRHRLLIVDSSEEFPMALSELLQTKYDVQYCLDGKEALDLLLRFQPDMLMLELAIPSLDGISLLHEAASHGLHPIVITLSRSYNDFLIDTLTNLHVSYWIVKPCNLHHIACRIDDLFTHRTHQLLDAQKRSEQVSELLQTLGFLAKYHGFAYLHEAIVIEAQTPEQSITKLIYPAIAHKFNCSKEIVERSIRTVIYRTWENRQNSVWLQYFPPGEDGTIPRPTNGAVISRLAQHIRNSR